MLPHLDAAYRLARWLTDSAADADDIVQAAILRAFRGFDALRGEDARAWLLVIVRNCHRSALRHEQRRPAEPLPGESNVQDPSLTANAPGPEEQAVAADERRALAALMRELPEEQREVLILKDIEDMSYREIASVIGVPIGTVMSRLARARAALRRQWSNVEAKSHALR